MGGDISHSQVVRIVVVADDTRLRDDCERGLARPDTDWHLPTLYDFLRGMDATSLIATHSRYVVDLNRTTYLDSSALGMLLLLRDHAGGDSAEIKIVNCNQDVKKILTISNFEQLFTIQ